MFNVPHRHAVLSISNVLLPIVLQNRFLQKVLMDAAIEAINDTISYKNRNGRLLAGADQYETAEKNNTRYGQSEYP